MIKFKQVSLQLMSAFLLGMLAFSASAQAMPEPQALVKEASDNMLKALKDNEAELETNPQKIYTLVQDILFPHFDFERMAKLALGRSWRDASAEQQAQFVEEFRLLLVRTYATAMLEYTNEEIRFLPFRDDLKKGRVDVPMEVVQPNGPSVPMALSLYKNKNDEWKVYDVKIEGISLVTNYRSSFNRDIRTSGMDALIENLAKRNDKAR
ncbi:MULTISPECIES: ABC transporter substrate-binding protein [unclassified Methylophaga]|jgi:phospholipid transport system substrate-binding protein|uniref:MlaC/ttg2D family ABC transporter substrate-binding protein n=1 Tax=unclassified Methylophaga TaxID=2629249 RepID=UPI000C51AB34|nr:MULTISPECIES: ABC transporter substrate-binding protein [unclassified Methylophaga]MAL49478.1 toluene tolerance protein [Methylophaga sp.]MAP26847.1 toluene tolerance protein [Methylophaga sp.]MBP25885.1 toluene tolerance protein [Methylophaga sp.]HAD30918.1 toluene tolerance protein [Methylophaga sp.]HCN99849.1 toluene tolerance protein [Methylophaga sp.]|tara:strand:- start:6503 stop:7129 length:627 start_codon:yes stop_codon:yes gene_type:complete